MQAGHTMTVKDLTREEVKAGVAKGDFVVVDVREPHEYASGHIPGSVNIPLSSFDISSLPDDGRQVVFSCAAGVRSIKAIELAQAGGLQLNEHYKGGFKDWVMSGEQMSFGAKA